MIMDRIISKEDDILNLRLAVHEFLYNNLNDLMPSVDPVPVVYNDKIQEAIENKRNEYYEWAFNIYVDIAKKENKAYSALTLNMYKVVLSAGLISDALSFLNLSYMVMGAYANTILGRMESQQFLQFKDYIDALKDCVYNNDFSLLKSCMYKLSGNDSYVCYLDDSMLREDSELALKKLKEIIRMCPGEIYEPLKEYLVEKELY